MRHVNFMTLTMLTALAANASAQEARYDINTGEVWIHDVSECDTLLLTYPMKFSKIDNYYDADWVWRDADSMRWVPYLRYRVGANESPLMEQLVFKSVHGFPDSFNLGPIMVSGVTDWDDNGSYVHEGWTALAFRPPAFGKKAIQIVPEPRAITAVGIICAMFLLRFRDSL